MADDEIDPDDLKEADEIFGGDGESDLPAKAEGTDQVIHDMLKEAKQNGLSRGDAIRKVADATGAGVQEIRPVADIVYGGSRGGSGGGAGREIAGELESGAEAAVGAVEHGAEGAAEGIGEAAGVTYEGISGIWELIGSWLVFLVALIGPLTAMNAMGVEMNAILGLTTIMMSGGAAILYAHHTDMAVFGIDFRAQHWTWAAGAGIFFGALSAFFGGGIVVAGAAVVLITIAWPILGRSSTRYARFFQRHEGLAALVGTGITVLMATHLYLIGVPTQLITILIGVLATAFYAGKIENDYVGLILTLAWFYYTGRWVLTLIGGDFVTLSFAVDLFTSILISTYVIVPRTYPGSRKEYTGFSHAWAALHQIPGAGDEFYEFGVAGFGLGLFFWFLAQGTGVAAGGLLSLAATWFIFISVLLVGPVHLKRSVNQIKAGAWGAFSDRGWAPRKLDYGAPDKWYNTEREGYREREEWSPQSPPPAEVGRYADMSDVPEADLRDVDRAERNIEEGARRAKRARGLKDKVDEMEERIEEERERFMDGLDEAVSAGESIPTQPDMPKKYDRAMDIIDRCRNALHEANYPNEEDRWDQINKAVTALRKANNYWDDAKYEKAQNQIDRAHRIAMNAWKAINQSNPNDPRGY